MNKRFTALDVFVSHERQARLWLILFVVSCLGFGIDRWHLAAALQAETKYIVVDSDAYYLPKHSSSFSDAKEVHLAQAGLAVEALFDRNPKGADHGDRIKRLFEKTANAQAVKLIQGEAGEFAAKNVHQKVEIGEIQLLQVSDSTVLASVEGQLLRNGIFGGKPFVEALSMKCRISFIANPAMVMNGGYPTLVHEFSIETAPIEPK